MRFTHRFNIDTTTVIEITAVLHIRSLTLQVLGPEYSGRTRSITLLLSTWKPTDQVVGSSGIDCAWYDKRFYRQKIATNSAFSLSINWPNSQIPQCTCPISHNAPFRTEMYTFLFWMVHCGISNRCTVGFMILVYCNRCKYIYIFSRKDYHVMVVTIMQYVSGWIFLHYETAVTMFYHAMMLCWSGIFLLQQFLIQARSTVHLPFRLNLIFGFYALGSSRTVMKINKQDCFL